MTCDRCHGSGLRATYLTRCLAPIFQTAAWVDDCECAFPSPPAYAPGSGSTVTRIPDPQTDPAPHGPKKPA